MERPRRRPRAQKASRCLRISGTALWKALVIFRLTWASEATELAGFLGGIVEKAHNRQMDRNARAQWRRDLRRSRSKSLDAPGWLWKNVVDLQSTTKRRPGALPQVRPPGGLARAL